jgi:predicted DNA-binding transcriptional regulator AlpA
MGPNIEEIVNCPELALKLLPEEARRTEARLEAALAAVRVRIRSLPAVDDNTDRLISVERAATMLGHERSWIYKNQARLRFVVKDGRCTRCSLKAVQEYMKARVNDHAG